MGSRKELASRITPYRFVSPQVSDSDSAMLDPGRKRHGNTESEAYATRFQVARRILAAPSPHLLSAASATTGTADSAP